VPRPNIGRSIGAEANVGKRIARQRELRGWTLDDLSRRMAAAECPIQPSGIYKTEQGSRRIVVDELLAYARVFDLTVEELLAPIDVEVEHQVETLAVEWGRNRTLARQLDHRIADIEAAMQKLYREHPEVRTSLEALVHAVVAYEEHAAPVTEAHRILTGKRGRAL
jgi:transcriptional regulator with XRE-family HTH domain